MFGFDDISFFCEINKRKSTEGGILTLSGKAGEVIVIIQTTGEVPVFVSNLRGGNDKQLNRLECFLEAADARPKGGADEIVIRNCVAEIREAA
ncbi:unnamed protein product [Camellia sinensis]